MWACLADEHAEEDEGRDPAVFLECVNQAEAEDGHDVAYHRDDDAPHRDGHVVVGHGGEHLACYHDVDDGEATAYNDVEHAAEFGAPEAEGVAGDCDLTEASLGELVML